MKKINRTYVMGVVVLALAAWIGWQTSQLPTRFVTNEPGPKLFPYISAIGMGVFAILSMIFDGPKETRENQEEQKRPLMPKGGWLKVGLLLGEYLLFALGMNYIGFWITSIVGMLIFFYTLKGEKKINPWVAILLAVVLGSLCYFGMTRLFNIPMPKGTLWKTLGITMP
ncbi:MAG: tripartite tricarboxylate transporter TctB family protein [Clostridia bacterium]|nr:tripartite tricarboxylate transporter TctB family protein [Clostridia bacterium]